MLQSLCLSGALALGLIAGVPSAQAATADSGVSHSVTTVLQIGKQAFTAPEYRALALADLPRGANPAGAADPAFVRAFADRRLLLDQARQVHLQDDPVVAVQLRRPLTPSLPTRCSGAHAPRPTSMQRKCRRNSTRTRTTMTKSA